MTLVRKATLRDLEDIQTIYLTSFDDQEKDQVAALALNLFNEETYPETFALVAETANQVIGHIGLSPVKFDPLDHLSGYILAPLAVKPAVQKQGIGSKLILTAMDRLKAQGVDILFVYGDPKYYGRFGFDAVTAQPFKPVHELEFPFGWMGQKLNDAVVLNKQPDRISFIGSLNDPALW